MAFNIAAGFASSRITALSSTETTARVQPAPQMKQMGIRANFDCLLNRISTSICENATELHSLDLGRLGHRAEVEYQLQETLTGLKDKLARKAAGRIRSAYSDSGVELYCKAS